MSEGFSHLGREFLTWLWYRTERDNGVVDLVGKGVVGVLFAHRLVATSGGALREDSTVVSDAPSLTEEARAALRSGKKVAKATLLLEIDERQFEVTVDAATFALSGVKLPTVLNDREDERLDERLSLLDELESLLDGLYMHFATLRLDETRWHQTRVAMHAWVTSESVAQASVMSRPVGTSQ